MYGDQTGEFVCGSWGFNKGIKDTNLGVVQALFDLSGGLITAASACGVSQGYKVKNCYHYS